MPQFTPLAVAVTVSGLVNAAPAPENNAATALRTAALFIPDNANYNNRPAFSRSNCYNNEQLGLVQGTEKTCDHVRSGDAPQNFFNLFNRQYKCKCMPGYVRLSNGASCVLEQACCGANEAYKLGIKNEETTCATLGTNYRRVMSGMSERYGCFCADGYVRSTTGQCVSQLSCGGTILCKQNEILRVDFLPEPTCSVPYPQKSTQSNECFCRPDFIRQYRDGPCIHKSTCTAPSMGIQQSGLTPCAMYEIVRVGFVPEPTCGSPYPSRSTTRNQCFCMTGFMRSYTGGRCIPRQSCNGQRAGVTQWNNPFGYQWQPQVYVPRTIPLNGGFFGRR